MLDVGNKIAELRKRKNWSQTDLAKAMQVSRAIICKYEKNENHPSFEIALKIARLFNVPLDYLIGEDKHTANDEDTARRLEEIGDEYQNIDTIGLSVDDCLISQQIFNSLKKRGNIEVVKDEDVRKKIMQTFSRFKLATKDYIFYPKNIFKISDSPTLYIVLCLLDFGYSNTRYGHTDHGTELQIWGYGLGQETSFLLRPKSKIDKLITRFFPSGINFIDNPDFNEKYYITSKSSGKDVKKILDRPFIKEASRTKNLYIHCDQQNLIAGFYGQNASSGIAINLLKILLSMNFNRERG